MKICTRCGCNADSNFCPECGNDLSNVIETINYNSSGARTGRRYCSTCGTEVNENAVVCVKCGCALAPVKSNELDEPSLGLNILSACFPIVGLIMYINFKNKTPEKAKHILMWGIGGFAVGYIALSLL